jgi:UDP-N-acetylmuramate dehydrogenase
MTKQETMTLRGRVQLNESMARHTSWRVGGPADRYYQPADIDDLVCFINSLKESEPVFWLGLGSNLLVRDGGIRGTVIAIAGCLNGLSLLEQSRVRVEVGVACPKLARTTAKANLTGLEFLSGIPGTLGGALAMNAGCLGSETWDFVESVEVIDSTGVIRQRLRAEYVASYRNVRLKKQNKQEEWFVAATLKLDAGQSETSLAVIKQHLARRSTTQPTQLPNAGSVFRNPDDDYAARLIEQCGLKNSCVGGACVSEKHANFIINTGTATASDIEKLINKVADTVKLETGVELQREVHMVGDELKTGAGS